MPTITEEIKDNIKRQEARDRGAMQEGAIRRVAREEAQRVTEEKAREAFLERNAVSAEEPARSDEEENARLEAALSCGPQCASSVLAIRYAKILRQERLLTQAHNALQTLEVSVARAAYTKTGWARDAAAAAERSNEIRREINEEKGNPA